MPAEVVQCTAPNEDQAAVIEILEHALEDARAGKISDIALVAAFRDDNGPQHVCRYYGQSAFATIVAGTASLAFDLQYRDSIERD